MNCYLTLLVYVSPTHLYMYTLHVSSVLVQYSDSDKHPLIVSSSYAKNSEISPLTSELARVTTLESSTLKQLFLDKQESLKVP